MKRRSFISFLGKGAVSTALLPPFIQACQAPQDQVQELIQKTIQGIKPSTVDDLVLAEGLQSRTLLRFGDAISEKDTFGFNCDYTAFIPEGPDEGLLWVNHEYPNPLFVSGHTGGEKTKEEVDKEMYSVGGSFVEMRKEDGRWNPIQSEKNMRLTGHTIIPFNWPHPIAGKKEAMGTFQNCSGGVTPWRTILTCEENYHQCYGECMRGSAQIDEGRGTYGWNSFYDNRPEHYGWVVEVDPQTGDAQKHVALGRFSHECATIIELEDGRVVVYSGDDKNDEHLYKFISSVPGSLKEGTLYVADLEKGAWLSLDIEEQAVLKKNFTDQTEVLIYCREASKLLGATPLDRPEDIEIDPVTGHVLVACTNNKPKKNFHGQIMKFMEKDGRYDALEFESEMFLTGGEETGFSCPDNLAFDQAGNLWFTVDVSGSAMNYGVYEPFGNNGLFMVPRSGPQEGEVIQMASAPNDAELTGPFFSPDGKTLFLSVQHPGETSVSLEKLTSHWPDGGDSIPLPSVVAIEGPLLEQINQVES
ncbi:MAG: DUF839 domain-containing protein [Flavobacteriales bacterium]|nr:DUF839 domain-containing protein [Flavobacteriales bacterium]